MVHTSNTVRTILFVAGDVSGDDHAANLILKIKKLDSKVNVVGVGGQKMQKVCDTFLFDIVQIDGGFNLNSYLFKLPKWIKVFKLICRFLKQYKFLKVVLVDFYGFNSKLLRTLHNLNIETYYYISPQFWASRSYRVKKVMKRIKKMLVIFPFEVEFINRLVGTEKKCIYVGHPLIEKIASPKRYSKLTNETVEWKLGLLPGSRLNEIKRHMPIFFDSFFEIKKQIPNIKAYIFATPNISDEALWSYCYKKDILRQLVQQDIQIIRENNYEIRKKMNFLITCSGTATLENALLGLPMIVIYKLSPIIYFLAKNIITTQYISLVNILGGKQIVKEYIQNTANTASISKEVIYNLKNPKTLDSMYRDLMEIRAKFEATDSMGSAAHIILE